MIHPGPWRPLPIVAYALACLVLMPVLAAAQPSQTSVPIEDVEVVLEMPWPGSLSRGFAPLFVRIQNHGGEVARVDLEAQHSGQDEVSIHRRVDVEAGQRGEAVLLVPFHGSWSSYVSVRVATRGQVRHAGIQGVEMNHSRPDHAKVLLVTDTVLAAGQAEAWSARLGRTGKHSFTNPVPGLTVLVPGRTRQEEGFAAELVAAASRYLVPRFQAYTSLDVVVIDTSLERDPASRFDGVLAWARMGGRVAFLGPDAEAFARALGDLPQWMEERFRVSRSWNSGAAYRYGLGVVAVLEQPGPVSFDSGAACETVNSLLDFAPALGIDSAADENWPTAVSGIEIPRRVMTLGLVLFVFLIWPVNFYLVRRWGRPVLVVLTVPATALVTSLGMLAYGTFYQGLDVKVATRSWTLLDQRSHRASSAEFRQLFAGLRPGHGLLPQAGTCVVPQHRGINARWRNERTRAFRIDLDGGTELSGDYLPPRQTANQLLLTETAARQRLFVRRDEDGALRVENGLGAAIERLVLKDAEGRYHGTDSRIDVGASATLEPLAIDDRAGFLDPVEESWDTRTLWETARCLNWREDGRLGGLLPATYAAVLRTNPWSDATGLELTPVSDEPVLVGVLSMDEGDWR